MSAVVHPRMAPRRGRSWATSWWAKAWVRAVEEAAYDEVDLRRGRSLARGGSVGGISVDRGEVRSAVMEREDLWSVGIEIPVLDQTGAEALVESVAAQAGRVAALLSGDLPHDLVEHAEEAGAELLPYGGELSTTCTCTSWVDPCRHALAVLLQLGWLVEDDPFMLLLVRGLARDDLLAAVHVRQQPVPAEDWTEDEAEDWVEDWAEEAGDDPELETALDAAARAARLLELLARPEGVSGVNEAADRRELDHLW